MEKKLKQVWVKALRSGKYRQGKEALYAKGRHCCLGVLRCLMPPKLKRLPQDFDNDAEMLNKQQRQFAGISRWQQKTLARMNDRGKDFSQIATYIAKHL